MDLNTICIGLLILPILYGVYVYYTQPQWIIPSMPKSLWGEQVGRSKLIQSKNGDASLFIEKSRRTANKKGGFQQGFMTAAIDYFFLTTICPCSKIPVDVCKCKCCDIIDGGEGVANTLQDSFDGGYAGSSFGICTIDGGAVIHGQNCACCPIIDGGQGKDTLSVEYSGGNANTQYVGNNINGGNV